ncbi:MAG: ABC transporter substrate-binding protein [Limosilactobacillus reuteri]
MKQKIKIVLGLIIACLFLPISTIHASSNRIVTDMSGQKVRIPRHIKRVADLWHANNQVVLLLGGQKKLVATTPMIKQQHWFTVVDPGIKNVTAPFAGNQIQIEELLKTKPDVVIASDPGQIKTARQAKLPVVNAMYTDFAGLKKSVSLTAQILGGTAPQIAKEYNHELDDNIKLVQKRLTGITKRPSVVHFVNANDLTKVDGRKTIVNEWIKLAGGRNAISKKGNQITVTTEELLKANPQVIIVGSTSTEHARQVLQKDPQLKNLSAVKNKRVYGNPQGSFPWDRYSAEEALQVLWAAKLLHPDQMKNINMQSQVKQFYQKYYHYQLSDSQAKAILNGEN